jgi:hypothetical protein
MTTEKQSFLKLNYTERNSRDGKEISVLLYSDNTCQYYYYSWENDCGWSKLDVCWYGTWIRVDDNQYKLLYTKEIVDNQNECDINVEIDLKKHIDYWEHGHYKLN